MSTTPPVVTPAPVAPAKPSVPLGWGSYVSLSGIAGAVLAFVLAWYENNWHLTGPIAALGVTAGGAIIGFLESRSKQFAALVTKSEATLHDLGIDITPPK
jgi:hypothetical protein